MLPYRIARTPEVKVENYLVFPVSISGALEEAGITISEHKQANG
jgi:hypothetical protein